MTPRLTSPDGHYTLELNLQGVEVQLDGPCITYPDDVEKEISRALPHTYCRGLDLVHLKDASSASFTSLPLKQATEEIVQMLNPRGKATLTYPHEGLRIVFKWDKGMLPSCLVWISNGGRDYFPWNGRNYCVGIEPIASAFDLPSHGETHALKRARSYNLPSFQSRRGNAP